MKAESLVPLIVERVDMDATVDVTGAGILGLGATRTLTYAKDWWDPYAGVRVLLPLDGKWSVLAYGDLGGLHSDSRSYQLIGGLNYAWSPTTTLKVGYRFYHMDRDRGGFNYDMNQRGFTVGVGFKI